MSDPITRLNGALEGRYEIHRELGEGGMATVYLADDLRHGRKVAVKVLKPELAAVVGAERFLAEIKTTANLQHPHILPLFDSGEAHSFLFYVMPYVEGESLREKLDREHQLPVDDAVRIATDVAEALDYAHGQGVIHRDIKPANIMLQAGRPVISDFGIALAVGVAGGGRLTETGLSLGTPYYMSPEQATGDLRVGAATDIYALGCVLYEMLVAEPPYTGGTPQAILGKIIAGKVASATEHRRSVPANIDAAIRKALERVPADRFTSAQEFAKALSDEHFRHGEIEAVGRSGAAAGPWNRLTVATTALAATFAVAFGWSVLGNRESEPPGQVGRFESLFAEGQAPGPPVPTMALTSDGSAVLYARPGVASERTQLWIRRWADLDAAPIRGTEGATYGGVLSPDDREVAFIAGGVLRVAPLDGGPSRTLVDADGFVSDWASDGFVYFSPTFSSATIARIPATGGGSDAVERLTELREDEAVHGAFKVLPGEAMGVFQLFRSLDGEGSEIWVIDLDTHDRRFLTAGHTPVYASTGHLLFGTSDGVLMAAPIDPRTAELTGTAVPVVEDLALFVFGVASYAVSESGTLIYAGGADATAGALLEPVWVTRSGEAVPVDAGWRFETRFGTGSGVRLSPDGTRVAVMQLVDGNDDIWIKHLPDGPLERLTSDDRVETSPFWSPDGEFVAYSRVGSNGLEIWQSRADGTGSPQLLLDDGRSSYQGRWSPGGEWVVFRSLSGATPSGSDILGFRPGVDSVAVPLVASAEFAEVSPALSPNGRWLAYTSDTTGRLEVYVRPFSAVESAPVTVSRAGGQNPLWAHDGRELFFVDAQGGLVAAEVEADSVFSVLRSETLFEVLPAYVLSEGTDYHDVAPDDERFLMLRLAESSSDPGGEVRIILVQNWFTELCERMGGC